MSEHCTKEANYSEDACCRSEIVNLKDKLADPCVGAGGMLLAAAQVLKKQGIDVRNEVLFYASDVDMTAVYMAYTQMSLMRMPAVLRRMDALSQKGDKDLWITLGVFVSQNLSLRLFRQNKKEAVEENPNPIER